MKNRPCIVMIMILLLPFAATAQSQKYTVEKGDTLYSISKKYNIKIESLKSFNNIDDPSKLYPGMEIVIPGGYTVKKGDTLYSIARTNNTTVDELISLNDLNPESILKEGQFLHVPVESDTAEDQQNDAIESLPENGTGDPLWPHSGNRTELTGKLRGVQIEGKPGDDILSVADGMVVWAGDYGYLKKLVLIESKNGLVYGYGGNEITTVKVGDYVKPGSVIGKLGGNENKADVFFFVYKDGEPIVIGKDPKV